MSTRGVRLSEGEDEPLTREALPVAPTSAPVGHTPGQGRFVRFPGVYRPQTDTLLLALAMRREGIGAGTDLLDLCTGTGALALHAARSAPASPPWTSAAGRWRPRG
ncbi:methyltransferase [Streptomyces californicus]